MISKKGTNNENKLGEERNNPSIYKNKELALASGAKANLSNIGLLATGVKDGNQIGGIKNRMNSEMGLLSKKQDAAIDSKFSNIYGGNNQSNNSAFIGASVYDFIGKNPNDLGAGKRGGNFGSNNNHLFGSDLYKVGGGINGGDGFQGKNSLAPLGLSNKNAMISNKYNSPTPDVNVLNKFHGF